MICYSKSAYRQRYPDHITIFNANIFTEEEGKVWYGDLDLTVERERLTEVARASQRTLYVLREMDGRFGNEEQNVAKLKEIAVATYAP